MKSVTETLLEEHQLVARAAACLDRVADEALATDDLCIVTAIDLLEFFQDFADGAHQSKEELHLFPALIRGGMPRRRVRELLEDHGREHEGMCAMWENLESAANGDTESRDAFARVALEYAALQREHAGEEDRVLIPLAEEFLDPALERKVLAGFREVDMRLLRRPYEDYGSLIETVESRLDSALWNWTRASAFAQLGAPC